MVYRRTPSQKLDSYQVRYSIKRAKCMPPKMSTIQEKYPDIYDELVRAGAIDGGSSGRLESKPNGRL